MPPMETTTIRVDVETHRRLRAHAQDEGQPMMEVVRAALDALEQARFAARVRHELADLRRDPVAWVEYLAEGDALPVGDGVD